MNNFKRIMALILVIVLVLGIIFMAAGCKNIQQMKNAVTVKVTDTVMHTVPEGYTEKDYVLLTGGEGLDKTLEAAVGFDEGFAPQEYYDATGECVGYYVIDENGWVAAWEDFDGKTHKLADDDQFEANIATLEPVPFDLAGTLELKFFMYVKDGTAVSCYQYFILSDAADCDKAVKALQVMDAVNVEKVGDNVLLQVLDSGAIQDIFALSGEEGTVEDFMENQKAQFGVTGELPEEMKSEETKETVPATQPETQPATEAAGTEPDATGETAEETQETTDETTDETAEATGVSEATEGTAEATEEPVEETKETEETTDETESLEETENLGEVTEEETESPSEAAEE